MDQIFNFSRFFKLFAQECFRFRKIFLWVALGLFVVKLIVAYFSSNTEFSMEKGLITTLIAIVGFSMPFILYSNINHKVKGLNYVMLPLSVQEKLVSCLLNCIVLVPIFCLIGYVLGGIVCNLIYSTHSDIMIFDFQSYSKYIAIQSVGLLGNAFFRRLKFQKTVGVIILAALLLVIFSTFMAVYMLKNVIPNIGPSFTIEGMADGPADVTSIWRKISDVVFTIVFPFGVWIAVFFRMKEQEY